MKNLIKKLPPGVNPRGSCFILWLQHHAVFDEVEPIVEAITPVPGGVGAVTTSVLMKHVVEAAEKT